MLWPGLPKRLQSALKGLCCLARSGSAMQSQEIADRIGVSKAETAKVMQLLAWGGFVTSRRGTKGGFQLGMRADQITTGQVIDFFASKYEAEPDGDCPVMRALRETTAPCQEAFGSLTLADIAKLKGSEKIQESTRRKVHQQGLQQRRNPRAQFLERKQS
jgi:Rrf2 family protein